MKTKGGKAAEESMSAHKDRSVNSSGISTHTNNDALPCDLAQSVSAANAVFTISVYRLTNQ